MAEQITLAYRIFNMRRWAGASWSKAAAWALGLVLNALPASAWKYIMNDY
ncbi:hypothetical protein [Comamonas sp.]|nr:hypothetical protein [Comamonas sp.]